MAGLPPMLAKAAPADLAKLSKTITALLVTSQETSQAQAAACIQELAKDHMDTILAQDWIRHLVGVLEADCLETRAAAASALSAIATNQTGREHLRKFGGMRSLVLLLDEGLDSIACEYASLALMNCAACDTCKAAICDSGGIEGMLDLIKAAHQRCLVAASKGAAADSGSRDTSPTRPSTSSDDPGAAAHFHPMLNGALRKQRSLSRRLSHKRAAANAAGTLMNIVQIDTLSTKILKAGGAKICEAVMKLGPEDDTVVFRCRFILCWLTLSNDHSVLGAPGQNATVDAAAWRLQQSQLDAQANTSPPRDRRLDELTAELQKHQRHIQKVDATGRVVVVKAPWSANSSRGSTPDTNKEGVGRGSSSTATEGLYRDVGSVSTSSTVRETRQQPTAVGSPRSRAAAGTSLGGLGGTGRAGNAVPRTDSTASTASRMGTKKPVGRAA